MADPDTATEKKTLLELGEVIAEGESARGGYDAYNAGNKATGAGGKAGRVLHSGVKDLSAFTVDQILASSDSLTGRDARRIFAAGKYQVITDTLRAAKAHLGLTGSERFTPALQEKIFVQYLIGKKRPEIGAYITRGVGTSEDATYAAAKAMGIDSKWLGQILAGEVSPTVDTLEKLFGAIGWEVVITFTPRE